MPGNVLGGGNDPEFLLAFSRASPRSESPESNDESDSSLSRGGGGGESALWLESEADNLRLLSSSSFNGGGVWIWTRFFLVCAAEVAGSSQCVLSVKLVACKSLLPDVSLSMLKESAAGRVILAATLRRKGLPAMLRAWTE
jgi:hypothetical protein